MFNQFAKIGAFSGLFTTTSRLLTSGRKSFSSTATMAVDAKAAHEFLSFVNGSPTPFHAVHNLKQRFLDSGYTEIKERNDWAGLCQPGGKYVLTRNASTIVAFAIGKKWHPGNPISIVVYKLVKLTGPGAHTDSPTLRIKPVSKSESEGFLQVGVETYGGGIWHSWFDRDLSIAGRVMVRGKDGNITHKLIKVDRPILRIPTLAIHLSREQKFEFSKETHLYPIAGLAAAELDRQGGADSGKTKSEQKEESGNFAPLKAITTRHHPHIVELIAKEADVPVESVVDFEIILYDTQKSCIGGLNNELMFSPRLDNLEMTFCGASALLRSTQNTHTLDSDSTIRLFVAFDNEEIGSLTAQGADSNLLPSIIRRLSLLNSKVASEVELRTAYERSLATSFLISADMAHSVNPNYAGKYEKQHKPEMNKGTVIKINANARYATNSPGIVMLEEMARRAEVPLQLFVVSNDSPCGSTIGPMLSGALGMRTLDLGNPQLSMHSIRECGGVYDVEHATKLFDQFYKHYGTLEKKILVD